MGEPCGIEYRVSEQAKADIYKELLPLLNNGKIELWGAYLKSGTMWRP